MFTDCVTPKCEWVAKARLLLYQLLYLYIGTYLAILYQYKCTVHNGNYEINAQVPVG